VSRKYKPTATPPCIWASAGFPSCTSTIHMVVMITGTTVRASYCRHLHQQRDQGSCTPCISFEGATKSDRTHQSSKIAQKLAILIAGEENKGGGGGAGAAAGLQRTCNAQWSPQLHWHAVMLALASRHELLQTLPWLLSGIFRRWQAGTRRRQGL
jgi:hypothetical protein